AGLVEDGPTEPADLVDRQRLHPGAVVHNLSISDIRPATSRGVGFFGTGVVTKVHSCSPSTARAAAGSAARTTPWRTRSRSSTISTNRRWTGRGDGPLAWWGVTEDRRLHHRGDALSKPYG